MRSTGIMLAAAIVAFLMFFVFDSCGKQRIATLEKTGKMILASEYVQYSNWGWYAVGIILIIGAWTCISKDDY